MLLDSPASVPSSRSSAESAPDLLHHTVRPLGTYVLQGLATAGDSFQGGKTVDLSVRGTDRLLALDTIRGYVFQIDPHTDNATIVNAHTATEFVDGTGLAVTSDTLWFARENSVYWCSTTDYVPQHFTTLPYPADGVAVWRSTIYVTCQKLGYILIFDRETQQEITRFPAPGVGIENLVVREEELWVCDRAEQTVYCIDRATGEVQFSILTPYPNPTGLTFYSTPEGQEILYIAYAFEEAYIRDDPNSDFPYELTFRDRTFIHPLHFRYFPDKRYTLSNGYLLEMSYAEELLPLEEVSVKGLEWRIALPADTDRQKVVQVEPIGMPFTEEIQEGQRVAVFKFDHLAPQQSGIFGWRALLEVRGIKYQHTYDSTDRIPPLPLEYQSRYLVDDDDLAMETEAIQQAARVAIGTETNLLRKILKIRNYVYDRLSYGIRPHIDRPDVVLERGIGSCGEYVGLLLALARLNGIACRTVGRYKCPPYPDRRGVTLEPDFNHVWIEFFIPGFGWVPMESNVDDVIDGGPYPTRFFMGLPWFHAEMAKGISFETMDTPDDSLDVSIGELAINHIRFQILAELPPP